MSGLSSSIGDKAKHVFVIYWLPFQENSRGWNNAWKLVKDLICSLLYQEFQRQPNGSRNELRVDVHYRGWYFATAAFNEEQHARKIFGRLAGSSWHRSTLTVVWLKVFPNLSTQYIQASNESSHPVCLESISPIKDRQLLWQQPSPLPPPSFLWRQAAVPAPLFSMSLRGVPGPRALSVVQNNPLARPPQPRGVIGGPPNQHTGHVQAQVPMPEYPFAAFAPFRIDHQQYQQIEHALSRISINQSQYWTPGSAGLPVATNTSFAWPSFSQSDPQPTLMLGSNSIHQTRPPIHPPIAGPPSGAYRTGRHSGPPTGSTRPAPLNQRKKTSKEGKKREAREGPEGKKMDSGPVIADGSGEGPA